MKSILWIHEVDRDDIREVGLCASTLGELVKNNIRVPNSFIINSSSFWNFLEEADIKIKILDILNNINFDEENDLVEKSNIIQELIRKAETPWELDADLIHAYRSLSQKSGLDREIVTVQLEITSENVLENNCGIENFPNIKNERELLKKVKECWEHYFSPALISYRKKQCLPHENSGVALMVQKMVNSHVFGNILMSYQGLNQYVIEAVYGAKSSIDNREIIPDKFIVNKDLNIENRTIQKQKIKYKIDEEGNTVKENVPENLEGKQKTTDNNVIKLAEIGMKIKEILKTPVNIEWCMDRNEIYILSCNSLSKNFEEVKKPEIEEKKEVEEEVSFVLPEIIPFKTEEKIDENIPVTATEIFLNLKNPEDSEKYDNLPIQGVLFHQGFLLKNLIKEHPKELIEKGESENLIKILSENYSRIAKAFHPKKVILELCNLKSSEYKNLMNGEKYELSEKNPDLGIKGCSRFLNKDFDEAFRLELRAIKKVREDLGLKNLWITLPFVRNLKDANKVIENMKLEDLEKGKDFKIFMNVEVPSNVILAKDFAEIFDGFFINLKNLTKSLLCIDSYSEALENMDYSDIRDKVIQKALKRIIKKAHKNDCKVTIIGDDLLAYPELVEYQIRKGINTIAFSPNNIVKGTRLIASLEQKILLEKLRE